MKETRECRDARDEGRGRRGRGGGGRGRGGGGGGEVVCGSEGKGSQKPSRIE